LSRGGDRELGEPVGSPGVLGVLVIVRGIEFVNPARALGLAGEESLPERLEADPDR
jgi:hypothetical protein